MKVLQVLVTSALSIFLTSFRSGAPLGLVSLATRLSPLHGEFSTVAIIYNQMLPKEVPLSLSSML